MNFNIRTLFAAAGIAAALAAPAAQAGVHLGEAVPNELVVTVGNLEWVYASPCAGAGQTCSGVQLSNGFNFATTAQWNASFTSLNELYSAFSTKCASSYFDKVYNHCDTGDILAGYVWHSPLAMYDFQSNAATAETFLVREAADSADVPEPASLALIGLGLAGLAARRAKARRDA